MAAAAFNHKLVPPLPVAGAIERTHLLRTVMSSAHYRIIFIQAPAGHGKTTLLQQIMAEMQQRSTAAGWITLDEGDDDPTRFMTQFHELIDKALLAGPGGSAGAPVSVGSGGFGAVDEVLSRLAHSGHRLALFIDEFQVIRSEVITSFLARLAARLPAHVTICFGSRSMAAIGLGRLHLRGQAVILKTGDLRFTRSETGTFFENSLDAASDQALVDELHSRTEGWPAALQLARLALAGGAGKGIVELLGFSLEPEFEEYVADNVLSAQSDETRDFLLQTSVLERFSPALCNALCGRQDAEHTIRDLEKSGLFIRPVGAGRLWFKYHSLFSSYLRKQLRLRKPEATAALHRSAARWFFREDHAEDAIHHAVEAQDFALAAEILEAWSNQLVREGRLATIERWLDMLPLAEVRGRPALQMKVLWALLFLRRFHKARPLLDALLNEIEQENADYARVATLPLLVSVRCLMEDDIDAAGRAVIEIDVERAAKDTFESFELGAIANIQSLYLRTRGDFAGAQRKAVTGSAHSDTGDAVFSGAYAMAFLGNSYLAQARLRDALETYRRGFEAASRLRGSYASAVVAACYGEALYYADAITDAHTLLEDALPLISQACMPDALAIAHVTLSKILLLKDKGVDAEYVLSEAEKIGNASGLPRVVRIVNWERVRQMLLRDDIDEARELAARILALRPAQPGTQVFHAEELDGDEIGQVRLLLYQGQGETAVRRLERLLGDPRYTQRRLRWLKLRMLQAWALDALGHADAAQSSMLTVLRYVAPEKLVRFVIEEAGFFSALERTVNTTRATSERDAGKLRVYFDQLCSGHARLAPRSKEEVAQIYDTLTEREVEILVMLCKGIANRDIGASLFVSENTVKYHLRNIYSKLGVRNRTEASNFALRHGIAD